MRVWALAPLCLLGLQQPGKAFVARGPALGVGRGRMARRAPTMTLEALTHAPSFMKDIAPNVRIMSDSEELSAGEDFVEVLYSPPPDFFRGTKRTMLTLMGGFNGWDGEKEEEFSAPLNECFVPGFLEPAFRCTIYLPNFARRVSFLITDGIRYDTNDDNFYEFHISKVRQPMPESDGSAVLTFRQLEDGTLIPAGTEQITHDPLELDRMMKSYTSDVETKANALTVNRDEAEPVQAEAPTFGEVDSRLKEIQQSMFDEAPLSPVQHFANEAEKEHRAIANAVADELGIGNIVIAEVRQAFDSHANAAETAQECAAPSMLTLVAAREALDDLGIEVEEDDLLDALKWTEEFRTASDAEVAEREGDDEFLSLPDFVHVYHYFDVQDFGLSMV